MPMLTLAVVALRGNFRGCQWWFGVPDKNCSTFFSPLTSKYGATAGTTWTQGFLNTSLVTYTAQRALVILRYPSLSRFFGTMD